MPTIIGVSGSLRAGSYNSMLLRAAAAAAPAGTTIEVATIEGIPLYNYDVEVQGIPEAVTALRERIVAADGLLLVTPEYNSSIPGVLKNAIDWLSRPPAEIPRVFTGRPVGIMGATPGPGGTNLSQAAWLPVLRLLGVQPWFGGRLGVSGSSTVFDAQGAIVDEKVRAQLEKYVAGFAKFVADARARA
jgi:NAD(P)H-dependent FMN reductase